MPNICIDAFKNLFIQNTNGKLAISPCCFSHTNPVDIIDFQSDPYLDDVRKVWLTGNFPSACSNCEKAESSGFGSRRKDSNRLYEEYSLYNTETELVSLDFWTGDTCNLRCAICKPDFSSAWKKELGYPIFERQSNNNEFWKYLDLSKIRFVHFNGGEPLLNRGHYELLENLPNKRKINISYNTNGTILPSEKLLYLWKHFKQVTIAFSIDDIAERFEYQRYPAKWSEVVANLQWYLNNCAKNTFFATTTSVGLLNHSNLDALQSWLESTMISGKNLHPVDYRRQPVHGLFDLKDAKSRVNDIKNFLDSCDKRRGTNWKTTFPELVQFINT